MTSLFFGVVLQWVCQEFFRNIDSGVFFLPSWLVTAIDNRYLKGDKKTRTGFPHQGWWCWVDSCVELAQKERGPETDLRKKLPVPFLNCRQHGSTCTGFEHSLEWCGAIVCGAASGFKNYLLPI